MSTGRTGYDTVHTIYPRYESAMPAIPAILCFGAPSEFLRQMINAVARDAMQPHRTSISRVPTILLPKTQDPEPRTKNQEIQTRSPEFISSGLPTLQLVKLRPILAINLAPHIYTCSRYAGRLGYLPTTSKKKLPIMFLQLKNWENNPRHNLNYARRPQHLKDKQDDDMRFSMDEHTR